MRLIETPLYVMAKAAGPNCNMACEYCYYLQKKDLYAEQKRHDMDDRTLELFIKQYIEAQAQREVLFTWHGGEALLRPLSFYRRAMELQRKYAGDHLIDNALQTNGLLLNAEWCQFLKQNHWLVGISIDGPAEFHDEYRRNVGGKPSHMQVMRAIRLLQQHGVEWNAMAVVNDYNADYPEEFYSFFKEIGCKYLQFAPIAERLTPAGRQAMPWEEGELAPYSVSPQQWGNFLCRLFDQWVRTDVGEVFVQIFDATLANWAAVMPGLCTMAVQCGHAGVIEHNGDLYGCDHFVSPETKLGNVHSDTILNMMTSEKQAQFGRKKYETLPSECRNCQWLFACQGECPKNRFAMSADGTRSLCYLCEGYRQYFEHVAPYMQFMKAELDAERPPANVMKLFKQ